MFVQYTDGNNQSSFTLRNSNAGGNDDQIRFFDLAGGSFTSNIVWSPVYRDPSAWYHIMLVADTTQATNTDRIKLYVNGVQVTATTVATWPSQNTDLRININSSHFIGQNGANGDFAGGYLTAINFIGGSALTPSSFGQTNASTGVWGPIAYTGSYAGTNSFYLNFSDNSNNTAATLGKDYSGNGNNWTPSNFSVTAGAGNDSMVDSPTSYGTDTGVGGEVRGNYCTLNSASPLATATANGNLQLNYNATNCVPGTIGVTTGKWYWEGLLTTQTSSQQYFGVANASFDLSKTVGEDAFSWGMTVQSNSSNGTAQHNNVQSSSYATFGNGDICMVAYDMDTGRIWFGRNGTWFNSGAPASGTGAIYSNLSGTIVPMLCNDINSGGVLQVNFGQRAFAYTAPSGFKALCTQNLPTPTIGATSTTLAGKYFNPALYTGNGNATAQAITGVGFQPDFVWLKARSQAYENILSDAVRGAGKILYSSASNAEATVANFVSFDSDGFTVNANGGASSFNANGVTYASWNWNAGNSTVTNTTGSISAQVRANATSGFSVIGYTGNKTSGATIGHGLGVAPAMVIIKERANSSDWIIYHQSLGATQAIYFTTAASNTNSIWFNNTAPSSTVITLGNSDGTNRANTMIAYAFAPVAGYSAFGSYTGNGSTDGPFVYTGFRPEFVMIKGSSVITNWTIVDAARNTYNVATLNLRPNSGAAETTDVDFDLLSNGFKMRGSGSGGNNSGSTYIYMAFAENPFKYSLAR